MDLLSAPSFPLQGEGISCRTLASSLELWVRCSFARLHKIRLCKMRPDLAPSKGLDVSDWWVPWERATFSLGNTVLVEVWYHHWWQFFKFTWHSVKYHSPSDPIYLIAFLKNAFWLSICMTLPFFFIGILKKIARWADGALFFEPSMNILEKQ